MFSHVGAASVTFEGKDRFQEKLLPRSGHSPAREINTLSHLFHENALISISIFSLNNNNNDVQNPLDAPLFKNKYDSFHNVSDVSNVGQ